LTGSEVGSASCSSSRIDGHSSRAIQLFEAEMIVLKVHPFVPRFTDELSIPKWDRVNPVIFPFGVSNFTVQRSKFSEMKPKLGFV